MFTDVFKLMEGELDVTLFKGGGPAGAREKVPIFLPRNGRFLKLFPIHRLVGRTSMHVECMTFALAMLPYLRAGRFDVVHCIDPPLARILYKLRRLFGMRFRLLFTHGAGMPPSAHPPADHLQEVALDDYEEGLQAGIPATAMTFLPVGIHPERFETPKGKEELRREYGVSPNAFVILSVAALNRSHKRTHHLVDEAARLEGDYLLWLDGSIDQGDPDLVEYARSRLGDRCALAEPFGLSIVEAASAGLPLLVHDAPHFHWLLPNPRTWVDMASPGALAGRLSFAMAHPESLREMRCREGVEQFTWSNLKPGYKAMYERVAALPPAAQGGATPNYFWQIHR